MASIARDPGGRKRILFVDPDGKRKPIRLGKMSVKDAEVVKNKVEALVASLLSGRSPDDEVSRWVGERDSVMYDKLAAVGLVPPRAKVEAESTTLVAFIDQYIASRPSMKPNTLKNYKATERSLIDFFGENRLLADITPGDADNWYAEQVGMKFAPATIGRNVKRARQFFRAAVRNKLIVENPFADVKAAPQVNKSREYFVTKESVEKIIAACPDTEWRLIVALARYGGLRTPSETFALRWGDVDWERGRIRVRSPKTAHHPGGDSRIVPLFPELRLHLEAAFDKAEPGTVYVIAKHRSGSANLRTQLERIMDRAGVAKWPRLFQNMRASRETELTQHHPLHVVVAWIGNSAAIATRHYLQVTDADYDKANSGGAESGALEAQNQAQQSAAECGGESQETKQALGEQGLMLNRAVSGETPLQDVVPLRGVEPRFLD